ncbi:C1 family peptidase [Pseudomonas sp. CGJS7]|uniref:C1 family peptidase n=1 Tax=Pseudomonas sp. CGJS7 TaxID=3109348 RepID=UPI00300BE7AD
MATARKAAATRKPAAKRAGRSATAHQLRSRLLDARPDTADFRDRMFEPTLIDVPAHKPLSEHLKLRVPVLDQGDEGACTAFGLAAVAHALLRRRNPRARLAPVSTRMFYDMARRYDEWRGEKYSGSSCRGAMKGWHHHGVCSDKVWPYKAGEQMETYTEQRARDAAQRPLGAYFRVNHKDLVAMHAAFAEVGVLFASSAVHDGWDAPTRGRIAWKRQEIAGYHAFAIVGYDEGGFWIQNSWGPGWGLRGYGYISYDEWLERGTDVWVARLAVPIRLHNAQSSAVSHSSLARQSTGYSQADLRPHIVSLGNNGRLRDDGRFGTTADDVRNLIRKDLPRITGDWQKKRVLLYAHGGLVPEQGAIQRVADYRQTLLSKQIYPLAFIWKTDAWTTLGNILRDVAKPRSEGLIDKAKDLLLDRLDDTLEPLARTAGGKLMWDEMKENGMLATTARTPLANGAVQEAGGAALVARLLDEWIARDPKVELHLTGHSAGSILLAPLVQLLTTRGIVPSGPAVGMQGLGREIESLTLWAPAITVDLFLDTYAPALRSGAIKRMSLFTLTDKAENDDHCAGIYHKSLLYLVAHAFEQQARTWINKKYRNGTPLLGMARFLESGAAQGSRELRELIDSGRIDWIQSPTAGLPEGSPDAASATSHGGFDDDRATLAATLARILGQPATTASFDIQRSDAGIAERRRNIVRAVKK